MQAKRVLPESVEGSPEWVSANNWERQWWGDCNNTHEEERKQIEYMTRMGLPPLSTFSHYPVWDFKNMSVVDMGGGPCSVLLKGTNLRKGTVVDPCRFPKWVYHRYKAVNIELLPVKGEELYGDEFRYDLGLMYNCLQHSEEPEHIAKNLRACCRTIRVFEWIETGISQGHLHDLKAEQLDEWFGGKGYVGEYMNTKCWYGMFIGDAK